MILFPYRTLQTRKQIQPGCLSLFNLSVSFNSAHSSTRTHIEPQATKKTEQRLTSLFRQRPNEHVHADSCRSHSWDRLSRKIIQKNFLFTQSTLWLLIGSEAEAHTMRGWEQRKEEIRQYIRTCWWKPSALTASSVLGGRGTHQERSQISGCYSGLCKHNKNEGQKCFNEVY